ncbi:MAG: hypothetical protein IJT16_11645 [Lachnospiraceae bacterium]|nr:hypothetical protein [Lachnospiraceae bacterium]
MEMEENANLILCLEAIGFTSKQITDFILSVTGWISMDEFRDRYQEEENKKQL